MARAEKSPPTAHVYRNLHKAAWSVRCAKTRLVTGHRAELDLVDCEFRVGLKGRARAVREGRRNVHAFVAGRPARTYTPPDAPFVVVAYNPFRAPHFVDRATGRPVVRAARVRFLDTGRAVAYRPEFARECQPECPQQ